MRVVRPVISQEEIFAFGETIPGFFRESLPPQSSRMSATLPLSPFAGSRLRLKTKPVCRDGKLPRARPSVCDYLLMGRRRTWLKPVAPTETAERSEAQKQSVVHCEGASVTKQRKTSAPDIRIAQLFFHRAEVRTDGKKFAPLERNVAPYRRAQGIPPERSFPANGNARSSAGLAIASHNLAGNSSVLRETARCPFHSPHKRRLVIVLPMVIAFG